MHAPPGKIECSEFRECYFRHSCRPFAHHNTNIQTEINIAWKNIANYLWSFSYIEQPNSYKWFSSCYRVPSIVGVVQEKFKVWEPQEH